MVAMLDRDEEMRHDGSSAGDAVATSNPLWQRFISIGEEAVVAWV